MGKVDAEDTAGPDAVDKWTQVEEAVKRGDTDYIRDLIEQGWAFSGPGQRKDDKRLYVYLTDPETGVRRQIFFTDPDLEPKFRSVKAFYVSRKLMKGGEKEEGEEKPKKKGKEEGAQLWYTRIEKSRPLLKSLVEHVAWLQDAILDIGFASMIVAMQAMKVRPSELYGKLEEYRNKDAFVSDVMNYLSALFESSQNAARIMELEDDLKVERAKFYTAQFVVETLKKQRDEYARQFAMVKALLPPEQYQRYLALQMADELARIGVIGKEVERK